MQRIWPVWLIQQRHELTQRVPCEHLRQETGVGEDDVDAAKEAAPEAPTTTTTSDAEVTDAA